MLPLDQRIISRYWTCVRTVAGPAGAALIQPQPSAIARRSVSPGAQSAATVLMFHVKHQRLRAFEDDPRVSRCRFELAQPAQMHFAWNRSILDRSLAGRLRVDRRRSASGHPGPKHLCRTRFSSLNDGQCLPCIQSGPRMFHVKRRIVPSSTRLTSGERTSARVWHTLAQLKRTQLPGSAPLCSEAADPTPQK